MSHLAPTLARISGWDRAAIVALGGAGCALSYDALQQMAAAVHIRGFLTYLFPLVIDGFIAYGVRALLVLRTAPLAARCYVWLLFGTATAASIWANSLHAVRLNQQRSEGAGLRLGDVTVGVLSTLAPLALAGAVHLYILIARRVTEAGDPGQVGQPDASRHRTDRIAGDRPKPTRRASSRIGQVPPNGQQAALSVTTNPDTGRSGSAGSATASGGRTDLGGKTVGRPAPATRRHLAEPHRTEPEAPRDTVPGTAEGSGRTTEPVTDALLPIARQAVTEAGKVTRQVVSDAVRGQNLPLANDRLTGLMQQLRAEAHHGSDTRTG